MYISHSTFFYLSAPLQITRQHEPILTPPHILLHTLHRLFFCLAYQGDSSPWPQKFVYRQLQHLKTLLLGADVRDAEEGAVADEGHGEELGEGSSGRPTMSERRWMFSILTTTLCYYHYQFPFYSKRTRKRTSCTLSTGSPPRLSSCSR
jgi:hypothetical protein